MLWKSATRNKKSPLFYVISRDHGGDFVFGWGGLAETDEARGISIY
jgi:hypothetical protein